MKIRNLLWALALSIGVSMPLTASANSGSTGNRQKCFVHSVTNVYTCIYYFNGNAWAIHATGGDTYYIYLMQRH